MKLSFLSLLLLVISFSCKKNIDYTIKGQVTDSSLGGNLSGATVELYTYSKGSVTGELLQTTQTDAQGNYSFTFDRDRYDKLEVKIIKANYFTDSKSVLFSELSNKEDYFIDLNLYARSWVRLHFVGDGSTDIKYIRQEGKKNCEECCTIQEVYLYDNVDTSIYCINNGNSTYKIYYNVLSSLNQGPLSVVTVPFDTTELLINY